MSVTSRGAEADGDGRYWDGVAASWAANESLWRRHSDWVNTRLLARWLPENGCARLLKTDLFDEAVSDGMHEFLGSRCAEATFIDASEQVVALAQARHPEINGRCADVRALPCESGSLDTVVSISTLDHFRDKASISTALAEIHRVLKPGGSLILTLDNLANPAVLARSLLPYRLLKRARLVPYFVGATLTPAALRRVVSRSGFRVAETDMLLHCPRVAVVPLARWLARHGSAAAQDRLLKALVSFEILARWPTRGITGHFTAMRAVKGDTHG